MFYTGGMATTSQIPSRTTLVRERIEGALPLVAMLAESIGHLSDAELVSVTGLLEGLGRHVDAARVRAAGEIDARSDRDRESSLARRYDCSSAMNLLAHTTHASPGELRGRIRLDRRARAKVSLTGEELPAAFPEVASALREGVIGVDVAEHLTDALERAARSAAVDPVEAAAAERDIVALTAAGFAGTGSLAASDVALPRTFDDYLAVEGAWIEFLTRDGLEPTAEQAARYRSLSVGRVRSDGLAPIYGRLTPEAAGALTRLLNAYAGSSVSFRTSPEESDPDSAWSDSELIPDPRTSTQIRHDALLSIVQAAAASASAPSIGGAAPTLVVTVESSQLAADDGVADIDGIDIAVPARVAHRIACTGAVQKVVFDAHGRVMALGSPQRLFTPHQRRAIAARDGGCIIPGCKIPAAWCELHHVEEHAKGGATHTDNGVLLCWAHHHDIDSSGWSIQMRDGVPYVKAPSWIDRREIYRPVMNRRAVRQTVRRRRADLGPPITSPAS